MLIVFFCLLLVFFFMLFLLYFIFFFFFSSRRRHTRSLRDWSSDVYSSDLEKLLVALRGMEFGVSEHPLQLSACFVFGNRRVQREGLDTIAMQSNSPKCLRPVFPALIFYIDRSRASKPKATNS